VLQYVLTFLYVIVCFLLLLVVLLQQGKGGDIASAFGGSSSQAAFGARAGATLLTKATTVLGVLFVLGALGLAIVYERNPSSLMQGKGGAVQTVPARPTPKPAVPPKAPAPAPKAPQQPQTK
jgi:preprotein translocase subunit SecG